MQRIGLLFVGLSALIAPALAAQQAAGTALWRVASTTLPTPPALALGPAAALWNPAQTRDSARLQLAFEAIQTPSAVDATGLIGTVRIPVGEVGQAALLVGRVGLSDIIQTTDSPDPTGATLPVYTLALGLNWSRVVGAMNLGATLAYHETRLDRARADRWTLDVGASHTFGRTEKFRVAAATHFFSSLKTNDPAQDIFAGIEARLWQSKVSAKGDRVVLRGRYGMSIGHGFTADHQLGVGAEFSRTVAFDFMLAREGSYGDGAGWRPVAGLHLAIGKYRVTVARDAGVNELGSAYRVGVEARFQ